MHEHRRIVGKTRLQVDDILALLDDQIAELKAKGKGKKKEGSDEAEGGPTLMGVTKVLNLNMQTLEKMIKLERVAAGIQDDDAGNTASRFLDELMREKAPN